jgi:2-polyprenyl-3-methyl-5-hydroxy-6-metoxy-1,4-benzoquinol methylase
MPSLNAAGYSFNEDQRIWMRPEYRGIAYSDGDQTEQRIEAIVRAAVDRTVLSSELTYHCTDWPSLYHLSSERANILRPVEHCLKGRVLEIGAGCGAITRYLGETGGEILALEGAPRRAAIAAARAHELSNVTVVAEHFDKFQITEKFDAITLIGVLEYAAMFSTSETPAHAMLQRIHNLLTPNGRLFIAIENQLGLKYFAGAPEDHLGVPMYGIENRYGPNQPRTYGRAAISHLLNKAGFPYVEICAPFPDYKLPRTILTETGLNNRSFDAAALIAETVQLDPQLPPHCHFDLTRSWEPIVANGLGLDTANSFLITASTIPSPAVASNVLAFHYRTDRQPDCCKAQKFHHDHDNTILVSPQPLIEQNANKSAHAPNVQVHAATRPYIKGVQLSAEINQIISQPTWTITQVATFIRRYIALLGQLTGINLAEASQKTIIPRQFINALPNNIIVAPDGTITRIGAELTYSEDIELGFLVFRALAALTPSLQDQAAPTDAMGLSNGEFVLATMATAKYEITPAKLVSYENQENEWRHTINRRIENTPITWHSNHPLFQTIEVALAEHATELDISHIKIMELEKTLDAIRNSKIWRITRPWRAASDTFRTVFKK